MTTMVYFDTLKSVKTLEAAGFPEKQAEALVKMQQESLSECLDTTLATKAYVLAVKTELKSDIQEVKNEIHYIKAEMKLFRWMLGVTLAGVGAIFMKMFF